MKSLKGFLVLSTLLFITILSQALDSDDALVNDHLGAVDGNSLNDSTGIQLKEKSLMKYGPETMEIGAGYYSDHPLIYRSQADRQTWMMNELNGASLQHEISNARALDQELGLMSSESYDENDLLEKGTAVVQMSIKEGITKGRVHFGVLQGKKISQNGRIDTNDPGSSVWKNPEIDIDEDYQGTFDIEKNISIQLPYTSFRVSEMWLPCCRADYFDLHDYYRKRASADLIFNCNYFDLFSH